MKIPFLMGIVFFYFSTSWTMQQRFEISFRSFTEIANESDPSTFSEELVLDTLSQLLFLMNHYKDEESFSKKNPSVEIAEDASFAGIQKIVQAFSQKNHVLFHFFRKRKMFYNLVVVFEIMSILHSLKRFDAFEIKMNMQNKTKKRLIHLSNEEILTEFVTIDPRILAKAVSNTLEAIFSKQDDLCDYVPKIARKLLWVETGLECIERLQSIYRGEFQKGVLDRYERSLFPGKECTIL